MDWALETAEMIASQQPVGGAGGEAADQRARSPITRDSREALEQELGDRGARQPGFRRGRRGVPRKAPATLLMTTTPAAQPDPRRSGRRAGRGDARGASPGRARRAARLRRAEGAGRRVSPARCWRSASRRGDRVARAVLEPHRMGRGRCAAAKIGAHRGGHQHLLHARASWPGRSSIPAPRR